MMDDLTGKATTDWLRDRLKMLVHTSAIWLALTLRARPAITSRPSHFGCVQDHCDTCTQTQFPKLSHCHECDVSGMLITCSSQGHLNSFRGQMSMGCLVVNTWTITKTWIQEPKTWVQVLLSSFHRNKLGSASKYQNSSTSLRHHILVPLFRSCRHGYTAFRTWTMDSGQTGTRSPHTGDPVWGWLTQEVTVPF